MIYPGLVSVTFRKLNAEQIISLVSEAGLDSIEWGGDIHVPHGNLQRAAEVGRKTKEAGLRVAAYGSYYRTGCENKEVGTFEQVLETAQYLGAPTIRVWAGNQGSLASDSAWRNQVVEDARRIASLAAQEGITISFEYHGNTLTDTTESAFELLNDCQHDNIRSLWQPPINQSQADNLDSLGKVLPWLSNVHVYHWFSREKYPLHEGQADWLRYFQVISHLPGDRYALLEFVKNETPEQFIQDAQVLKEMLQGQSS